MCEVVCPMKDKCSDYGKPCNQCKRNAGKRSYYDPDLTPYYPYYPHYPTWTPYTPYVTHQWVCVSPTLNPNNSYFQPIIT